MKTPAAIALFSGMAVMTGLAPCPVHADPSAQFVNAGGYAAVEADRLWDAINEALSEASPQSALLPAADIGPMPLAVFALDMSEPGLERVRYRIRYGTNWIDAPPSAAPLPISYIEVVRFNLGPAIRDDLIGTLGDEHVAGEEEFGVGPHVGWRLMTRPIMGNRAMIMAAGRMEIGATAAQGEACLGSPCLDVRSPIETAAAWGELEHAGAVSRGPWPDRSGNVVAPAVATDLLLGEIDDIETDMAPSEPKIPDWAIEAVIDVNLGQDEGLDAVYRWDGLLDGSVAAIWERLASFSTGSGEPTMFRARAYECARGPEFAPPGEFCP